MTLEDFFMCVSPDIEVNILVGNKKIYIVTTNSFEYPKNLLDYYDYEIKQNGINIGCYNSLKGMKMYIDLWLEVPEKENMCEYYDNKRRVCTFNSDGCAFKWGCDCCIKGDLKKANSK